MDVETQETLPQAIERLGLSIRAKFVPFSQSRNAHKDKDGNKPSDRSLNWRVTLVRRTTNGEGDARFRDVITTDYSAGIAHCPSYKQGMRWTLENAALIERETETGYPHCLPGLGGMRSPMRRHRAPAIMPKEADVIYSLALDSDVIDYATFEDWASELGYDPDSRSAEATYRACLEIALKVRATLGDDNLAALRAATQDY